jgi:hypothetical protein
VISGERRRLIGVLDGNGGWGRMGTVGDMELTDQVRRLIRSVSQSVFYQAFELKGEEGIERGLVD